MKIRKMFLTILSVNALFVGSSVLSSCAGNEPSDSNVNQVTLSSDERQVYNSIVGSITAFKDPGSVTLTWVSEKPLLGGRYVKINAKNSFGGYVVGSYQCNGNSLRSVDTVVGNADNSVSISKINSKLSEYKSTMGYY